MKSLIYVSKADKKFTHEEVLQLTNKSAEGNEASNITGFLCFMDGHFLQYIEGESVAIGTLFAKIEIDNRHSVISSLYNDEDHKAKFSSWKMKYLDSEFFHTLDVESFLSSQLQLMKEQGLYHKKWKDMIWQGVNILANKANQV